MYGCLHAKVLQAPPYGWCIFWHRFPTHAFHGSSRIQIQEACQPVCPKVYIAVETLPCGVRLHVNYFLVCYCKTWKKLTCDVFVLPGCMGSRSTPWPTSCSCRQPPASRVPSRPSARESRTEEGKICGDRK